MKLVKLAGIFVMLNLIFFVLSAQKAEKTNTYLNDQSSQPPEMFIDISHMKAEVKKIEPVSKYVETNVTYTFKVLREKLDSIIFYAPDIKITKCLINKADAKTVQSGGNIIIYPSKSLEFQKEYELFFECSNTVTAPWPVFTGWDDKTNTKRKQIWGLAFNRIIPDIGIKHDLMSTELILTFDSKYKVFSNGERLMQKVNKDGTTTWHYKLSNAHNFYLMDFVIGDYNYEKFKTDRGLNLEYWYYADKKHCFEPTYRYSKEMFAFLEKEFGLNYPWELYRQAPVIDCPFGGMECTTATIFNDMMQVDSRGYLEKNYVNVNVHELIHQWFGNYNSYTNGQNIWTSESFATYFAKKFEEHIFGENHYQKIRNEELLRTLDASKNDDYPIGHNKGGVPRFYPKGSLVLDMLRYVMGEKEFLHFIAYYLNKHQYAVVEWNDIKVAVRESTGMTIDWFLDEWIHRGGEPHYKVSYKQMESLDGKRNTHIYVKQIHEISNLVGYFKMPVITEVHYKDGSSDSKKQWIDKELSEIIIPNNNKKEIAYILFDPNRNIIKKLTFDRSFEELKAQVLNAKNMIDRYDALLEMKKIDIEKKRELLIDVFNKESYFMLKAEVIAQLAEDKNEKSIDLFKKAINDKDTEVRRAVTNNIKLIDKSISTEYEKLLKDSSYYIIASALENLAVSFPQNREKYLSNFDFDNNLTDESIGQRVKIKWLEIAYETRKDEKYAKEIAEYTNINRFESGIVMNALLSVKKINYMDQNSVNYLFQDLIYWNDRINPNAKDALLFFNEQLKYRKIIKEELMNLDKKTREKIMSKISIN